MKSNEHIWSGGRSTLHLLASIVHKLGSGLALINSFGFGKFGLWKRTGWFASTGQSHWSRSMSPRGLEARFLFPMHTHAYGHQKPHTQRGTCILFQAYVSHSQGTVPSDSGNTFVNPPYHPCTHTHFTSLRLVVLEEHKSSLSLFYSPAGFSMACLAYHPAPRRSPHVGSLLEPHHPVLSLTIWTHTNTETHMDRFSGHTSTTTVIFLARG